MTAQQASSKEELTQRIGEVMGLRQEISGYQRQISLLENQLKESNEEKESLEHRLKSKCF